MKVFLLTIYLFLIYSNCFSQDVKLMIIQDTSWNNHFRKNVQEIIYTTGKIEHHYGDSIDTRIEAAGDLFIVYRYYKSGELESKSEAKACLKIDSTYMFYTLDSEPSLRVDYSIVLYKNGTFTLYYPNGNIKEQGKYLQNTKVGIWIYRDESGEYETFEEW